MVAVTGGHTTDPNSEWLVFDFKDAFKQLTVCANGQRFMAGQVTIDGVDGFFVYHSLLFGAVLGPLLWGRLPACHAGKWATSSLFSPTSVHL